MKTKSFHIIFLFILLLFNYVKGISGTENINNQVEHVPIENPVYKFLQRSENMGLTYKSSLAKIPMQRKEVSKLLLQIKSKESELNSFDKSTLNKYLREFHLQNVEDNTLIYSNSDTLQVISEKLFSENEKYLYRLSDSEKTVSLRPLARMEIRKELNDSSRSALLGTMGFRLYGNLDDSFGYYLQATNGSLFSGSKAYTLEDTRFNENIKFTAYNSDIDFTESHIHYEKNWFNLSIGRENRLLGNGIGTKLYQSAFAPSSDAIEIGTKFTGFHYYFTFASVLANSDSIGQTGYLLKLPPKFVVTHRFSIRPEWGEIGFWESIVFSDRSIELAYINPLSFFKSLEHALRDRDNSLVGWDFNVRPFKGLSIRGSYILDDIIFSYIGTGYWSNKAAMNLGAEYSSDLGFDIGAEYTRIEPYTFSHFNPVNSYSHDGRPFGSYLQPNSELWFVNMNLWIGSRYPLNLQMQYMRHGDNVYDNQGKLMKNVGGNIEQSIRFGEDSYNVTFLEGNLTKLFTLNLTWQTELMRGFNLLALVGVNNRNGKQQINSRLAISFEDF